MMFFVVILVLFTETVLTQNINNNNKNNNVREGATCELTSKEKGICIRISLCSSAREQLKQRKIPENCGFINGIPITCCSTKPRKMIRKLEKKCKYIELSRFGFIAETMNRELSTSASIIFSDEKNHPSRMKISSATTIKNVIPNDFSRFPVEKDIENKYGIKNENINIIPSDFSRFPSKEEKPDIKFEQNEENTNKFPFVFSRFGFDENDFIYARSVKTNKKKIHTRQNQLSIPIDFSRFSFSSIEDTETPIYEDNLYNDLKQYEFDLLPELDFSSKDISDLIIRETPNHVLGGQNAKISEFPHMAALGYEYKNQILWLCGGSLISDEYVLTAAHCLNSLDYGTIKWIRLGDINRESTVSQKENQDFRVAKAIPYPLYRIFSTYHDIALIKLDRKAVINNVVNTICLFTEEIIPPSLELWATGWGLTSDAGNQSDILQKVELNLFTEEECNKAYSAGSQLKYGVLHKQQICAGGRVNQKDTCQGDSGGPLHVKMNRQDGDIFYLVGVTSFGKQCGNKNIPGIYTRISFYLAWIENIIWPDEQ